MKTADVKFRKDLYPRIETSPGTVQKYGEDLDVLPPIEVNQHNELIDGWHRWTAFKERKVEEIPAKVTKTRSDAHFLELAIERNATHGMQLSQEDKRRMARSIYNTTAAADGASAPPGKNAAAKRKNTLYVHTCTLSGVQAYRRVSV